MFTPPCSGSGLLVSRPTASSGTIATAANAYDLPSGRPDDPPYTTYADKATITGSLTSGTVDYDVVEFNTFTARSKTTFSECQLSVGVSTNLSAVTVDVLGFVTSSLDIDYQIDGTNWTQLKRYTIQYHTYDLGVASNYVTAANYNSPGYIYSQVGSTETLSVVIPSSSFPSNLSSLKVRFRLGTCTNSTLTTSKSFGSYRVWDIRANIS